MERKDISKIRLRNECAVSIVKYLYSQSYFIRDGLVPEMSRFIYALKQLIIVFIFFSQT